METEQVFPAREIESDMPDGLKVIILLADPLFSFSGTKSPQQDTQTCIFFSFRQFQIEQTEHFLTLSSSPSFISLPCHQFAVFEAAQAAILDNKIDKDVATTLKKKFDTHDTFGGTWHCIVGKNFGCSITHET